MLLSYPGSHISLQCPLAVEVSQTSLVFDDLDSSAEHWSDILEEPPIRIGLKGFFVLLCLILFFG